MTQIFSPQGNEAQHVTFASTHELDHLVGVLTEIVVASQDLSEENQRRMRNFVCACGDLMMSRTRLDLPDRRMFENALREAVARRQGR